MTQPYEVLKSELLGDRRSWLVTGAAGFIGSNLVEALLKLGQRVVGLDNLSTGNLRNLEDVSEVVGMESWSQFTFIQGDITNFEACLAACQDVDYVLHQAALGSVPRSIEDPLRTHQSNVDGFVAMLVAARDAGVKRLVYAASSSTYGDHPGLPKVEDQIGEPLSPYALSKYVNELYASMFARTYGIECVGLRYFNVFGPRQDPEGAYAAVIPRWIENLLGGECCTINGDGKTSRDFCFVSNAVQANLLAALSTNPRACNDVYNVAFGARTSLTDLYLLIQERVSVHVPDVQKLKAVYADFRAGDVRHSQADISKAKRLLNYSPTHSVEQGLDEAVAWYISRRNQSKAPLVKNGSSR